MKRWYLSMVWMSLGLLAGVTHAQSVKKTAEASMLVTGSIEVNPDGSLHGYTIDEQEKLPPVVVDVMNKSVPHWQFKLSSPTTQIVKTHMSVRLVAKPTGDGNYRVAVEGASFSDGGKNDANVSSKDRVSPKYPSLAVGARVSGTVYLLLRVGRSGTVEDAIAEQVNLEQYASRTDMDKFRKALADASLDAARQWTFNPPSQGSTVNDPYWVVRVPVAFSLNIGGMPLKDHRYGKWDAYIPGPRETAPWASKDLLAESPDALPDGALRTGNSGLVLTTPLGGVSASGSSD
ncbi:energy transducer TonB [Dyella sp. C11]|uniref:energy transducer TonB n=1 Tax=Dyella sp. C11 TaxID=2126991 RepID=UPI000D658446|nr:energy transducer TonB [Dyella sp. C11]